MRVCESCVEDDGLRGVVKKNAHVSKCDFCDKQIDTPMACELGVVINYMRECIAKNFCTSSELPADFDQLRVSGRAPFNAFELFERIGFYISNEELLCILRSHFAGRQWCELRWFSTSKSETNRDLWADYCNAVKEHAKSSESNTPSADLESVQAVSPNLLDALKTLADLVAVNCIEDNILRLWRVQVLESTEEPKIPDRFTSPPPEYADKPGRMNRAGVSVFYGAADLRTAYEESVLEPLDENKVVWAVQFEAARPLEIMKLANEALFPSYFSRHGSDSLHESWFLDSFLEEISKPIVRNGQQHIEYAPSQVMAEYFLNRATTLNQRRPDGLVFKSSKTGGECYVVFADQSQCLDVKRNGRSSQLLRMVPDSLRCVSEPPEWHLAVMNSFIRDLVEEHRNWLSSFAAQYGKNWENILRNDREAAWAEAGVRRILQAQAVTVSPNEDLSGNRRSPDFRCDSGGYSFYVEVASIPRETANEKTGFQIDGEARRFIPLNPTIIRKCIAKASQCSGQDAPVLVACTTFSGSALLAFAPEYVRMLLAGKTTSSVQIDPATGKFVGGMNQSTNLEWSAFYRFTPDGEEIETARSSISGLLLCAPGVGDGYTVGVLNPDAVRTFDPSVLPGIPFETAQVERDTGTFRFNQTEKEKS